MPRSHSQLYVVLLLSLSLFLIACGKKGLPEPSYNDALFSWRNVQATLSTDGCLSISGAVDGSIQNVESILLEVQAMDDTSAACLECPFVPMESFTISSADAWISPEGDAFRFAYCPSARATIYRWRIVGQNVVRGLPKVQTPVRTLSATQNFD